MKNFIKKLIKRKNDEIEETRKRIKASDDANEVRALGETLDALKSELDELETKLAEMDDEGSDGSDDGSTGDEGRSGNPIGVETRGFNPLGSYGQRTGANEQRSDDPTDSVEYRTAFMNFVCRNVPIPAEVRANAVTTTTDAGAVIPKTIINEIVKEMKGYGNLYSKVRKLNVQGGVEIPILDLKPTATWITANTGTSESDLQKIQANTSVSFSYFGLECKVAQTLLVNVTTLDVFQSLFVELATEAIVQAIEVAIINGTGSGQMTGITVDSRVPAKNKISIKPSEIGSWENWKKMVFAKMKKSYRNGVFIMSQSTFDSYIDGMTDSVGQPIGRVNYGIDNGETYRFGGKIVEIVEDDVLPSFDDASNGKPFAVFVNLSDYGVNSNMEMKVVKWEDHDTNQIKNKAILICDGKLIDPNGVLVLTKGAEG